MRNNFDKYGDNLFSMLKRKQYGQMVLAVLIIIFVLSLQYFFTPDAQTMSNVTTISTDQNYYPVKRIVDGDTFVYTDGNIDKYVRLLGADTPETKDPRKEVQCFGAEANKMTTSLLTGQSVRLEADPLAMNNDRYGRELRYVYLTDGRMLNSYLIKEGYAHVTLQSKFLRQQEFVNLENEAKMTSKGLWAPGVCN